jgi:serine/threonine-protein kinase
MSMRWGYEVGRMLYFARRYDHAGEQYKKMIELNPSYGPNRFHLGLTYVHKGMLTEAIAEMQKGLELKHGPAAPAYFAYALAVAGRTAEARKVLHEFERESISAGHIALIYVGLGENEQAFDWLEKAYETNNSWLFQLQDPIWDPLRDDPRFEDLLRRLNLPVQLLTKVESQ